MNQYKCRIHGFIKNKDVHHWHYTDENEKCDCEPVEAKAEAREPGLRELLEAVLPETMGGYPDLFAPSYGWEEWEEKAKQALAARPVEGGSSAWDMLHAIEAADAAGELAENIGGELSDALRAELTRPLEAKAQPTKEQEIERLQKDIADGKLMRAVKEAKGEAGEPLAETLLRAPCIFCGYTGPGYYQTGTHADGCPWKSVGGGREREHKLREVIEDLHTRPAPADPTKWHTAEYVLDKLDEQARANEEVIRADERAKMNAPDGALREALKEKV